MPVDLLFAWLMVFLRGLGVILLFPTLAGRALPPTLRVSISACLATLLYSLVPAAPMPTSNGGLITSAGGEIILGLVFGFVGRLTFVSVELAGRVIANEIGMNAAPGFDTPQPSQEPIAALLSMLAGVMFFSFGGHFGALTAFARSFELAHAGAPAFGETAMESLINYTGRVVELGFRIAAPFIALNFLINLAFAVLGRAVPRMNVFVMSVSLRLMAGLGLLAGAGTLLGHYIWTEFDGMPFRLMNLLPHS